MPLWDKLRRQSRQLAWSIYVFLAISALAIPLVLYVFSEDQKLIAVLAAIITALGSGVLTNVVEKWVRGGATSDTRGEARRRYLSGLRKDCQLLPLAALGGGEGLDETLRLDQVYIALDTETPVAPEPGAQGQADRSSHEDVLRLGRRETTRLSARAALSTSPWLALLGDPGGGKSTFVRQIVAEIAASQELGDRPEPDLPSHLLPVLINLRDLTPALGQASIQQLPEADRRRVLARLVRDQAVQSLDRLRANDFADGLCEELENGRCFLVLDGLDEMPERVRP